jgi:hypothetical protein
MLHNMHIFSIYYFGHVREASNTSHFETRSKKREIMHHVCTEEAPQKDSLAVYMQTKQTIQRSMYFIVIFLWKMAVLRLIVLSPLLSLL